MLSICIPSYQTQLIIFLLLLPKMNECTRDALLLVAFQFAAITCIVMHGKRPGRDVPEGENIQGNKEAGAKRDGTIRYPLAVFLLGTLFMFLGIMFSAIYPMTGWIVFTGGVLLYAITYRGMRTSAVIRGLAVCACLLLVCGFAAPYFGNFVGWTPWLVVSLFGLLLILIFEILWPTSQITKRRSYSFISTFGAVVFALWTIRDVTTTTECHTPFEKSIQVFLDLINLFNFSILQ